MNDPIETVWRGRFLDMKQQGTWEFVGRARDIHAAVILAIDAGEVILVEQYRVPLGKRSVELPAGLVGDQTEGEDIAVAAARELQEETGYRAGRIETIGEFYSSPGMASEGFTLVRAHDLTRVGEGGGDADEDITVHRVALADIARFVTERRAAGCAIDVRMLLLLAPGIVTLD